MDFLEFDGLVYPCNDVASKFLICSVLLPAAGFRVIVGSLLNRLQMTFRQVGVAATINKKWTGAAMALVILRHGAIVTRSSSWQQGTDTSTFSASIQIACQ